MMVETTATPAMAPPITAPLLFVFPDSGGFVVVGTPIVIVVAMGDVAIVEITVGTPTVIVVPKYDVAVVEITVGIPIVTVVPMGTLMAGDSGMALRILNKSE